MFPRNIKSKNVWCYQARFLFFPFLSFICIFSFLNTLFTCYSLTYNFKFNLNKGTNLRMKELRVLTINHLRLILNLLTLVLKPIFVCKIYLRFIVMHIIYFWNRNFSNLCLNFFEYICNHTCYTCNTHVNKLAIMYTCSYDLQGKSKDSNE